MKTKKQDQTPAAKSHPFWDVRRASAPLTTYETSDPAATITNAIAALNGNGENTPVMQYDISRLLLGVNKAGQALVNALNPSPLDIANPSEFLKWLCDPERLPTLGKQFEATPDGTDKLTRPGAILFVHNGHKLLQDFAFLQATWNCRDPFKSQGTSLVLLTLPGAPVPPELANDVVTLTDPKPGPAEAAAIIKRMAEAAKAGGATIDPEAVSADEKTVDRALGTSGFGVEQIVALSMRKTGLDVETLTARQRKMIEQTKGLTVLQSPERIEDIAGHVNVIEFLRGILSSGRTKVNAVMMLDEVEKSLGAGTGDTSGTSQDQAATFLKVTQDYNIPAIMLIGPGGSGKSLIAKAAGKLADCLTLAADLGACKGSLVGESEQNVRAMFDTAGAVSQWKLLIIATCNRIAALTPEIRRRFKLGTFFVDVLSEEERAVCWKLKRQKFQISADDKTQPAAVGWTGAEIEACCEIAWRRNCTLGEAGKYIVPVAISAKDEIEALRKGASNRFISASQSGLYQYRELSALSQTTGRSLQLD